MTSVVRGPIDAGRRGNLLVLEKDPTGDIACTLSMVGRMRSAIKGPLSTRPEYDADARMKHPDRSNDEAHARHLRPDSQLLEQLIQNGTLPAVGTERSSDNGVFEGSDRVPDARGPG